MNKKLLVLAFYYVAATSAYVTLPCLGRLRHRLVVDLNPKPPLTK